MAVPHKSGEEPEEGSVPVTDKGECFVIMPISDPEGYEEGHFRRVYEDILAPAIAAAGFIPVRADEDRRTN